jgi:hypothetical protein
MSQIKNSENFRGISCFSVLDAEWKPLGQHAEETIMHRMYPVKESETL